MSRPDRFDDDDDTNVVPLHKPKVIPQPLLCEKKADIQKFIDDLDASLGYVSSKTPFRNLAMKGFNATAYTLVRHADGHPVAVDVRYESIDPNHGKGKNGRLKKTHRIVFRDRNSGELSFEHKALAEHDLLLPANVPELVQALKEYEAGEGPPVVVLWAEGEKARKALERLMAHPHALAKAKEQGVRVVTSAWFCALYGVQKTNFELAPRQHQPPSMTVAGVNDKPLDLNKFARIMIVRDNDADGMREATELLRRFRDEYRIDSEKLVLIDPPPGAGPAWDDAEPLPRNWTEEARIDAIFDAEPAHGFGLMVKRNGEAYQNLPNCRHLLEADPFMRRNYRFNEFTLYVDVMEPVPGTTPHGVYPRTLSDVDEVDVCAWLQQRGLPTVSMETARNALIQHARANPRHPVREYLKSLVWDGVPRIENSMTTYFGAEGGNIAKEYLKLVGRYWWIMLVSRPLNPGGQADYVLELGGPQGIEKSKALHIIAREERWYTDSLKNIHDERKAGDHMRGKLITEFAERVALRDAPFSRGFITQKTDEYIPPYGREKLWQPRQGVLVATANDEKSLHDPTGDRRYWPVWCTKVETEALRRDVDQLYAEAVHRYEQGERFWPTEEEQNKYFTPRQEACQVEHGWQVLLSAELERAVGAKGVVVRMDSIIQFLSDRHRGAKQPKVMEISAYLRRTGWTNIPVRSQVTGKMTSLGWWREDQKGLWVREGHGRPAKDEPEFKQVTPNFYVWLPREGTWAFGGEDPKPKYVIALRELTEKEADELKAEVPF
jgi:predicted P-loop ATPase